MKVLSLAVIAGMMVPLPAMAATDFTSIRPFSSTQRCKSMFGCVPDLFPRSTSSTRIRPFARNQSPGMFGRVPDIWGGRDDDAFSRIRPFARNQSAGMFGRVPDLW